MKRLCLSAIFLIFLSFPVFAQDQVITGSLVAANDAVTVPLGASLSVGFLLSGTWTATVIGQISIDGGTTWVTVSVYDIAAGTSAASYAANGSYLMTLIGGATHARVKASAYTSGTVAVTIYRSRSPSSVASANTPFPVKIDQTTPGTTNAVAVAQIGANTVVTGGVNGSLGVGGTEANNVAPAGNPLQLGGYSWTDGTAPTVTTAGRVTRLLTSTDTRLVVTTDHPKRFSCSVLNSSATILTAFGSPCAAPGAGLSLYITDITASSSVISTTTTDQALELKSGTGGSCGAATAVVWAAYSLAFDPVAVSFVIPIKITANSELCWMHAATGSKTFIINGYIAP